MIELSQVAAPFRMRYIKLSQAKACAYQKKTKAVVAKFNSYREAFRKNETKVKVELEEAGRNLKELGERFKWWQTLP